MKCVLQMMNSITIGGKRNGTSEQSVAFLVDTNEQAVSKSKELLKSVIDSGEETLQKKLVIEMEIPLD